MDFRHADRILPVVAIFVLALTVADLTSRSAHAALLPEGAVASGAVPPKATRMAGCAPAATGAEVATEAGPTQSRARQPIAVADDAVQPSGAVSASGRGLRVMKEATPPDGQTQVMRAHQSPCSGGAVQSD